MNDKKDAGHLGGCSPHPPGIYRIVAKGKWQVPSGGLSTSRLIPHHSATVNQSDEVRREAEGTQRTSRVCVIRSEECSILYSWYQSLASISSPGCFPSRPLRLCGETQEPVTVTRTAKRGFLAKAPSSQRPSSQRIVPNEERFVVSLVWLRRSVRCIRGKHFLA